jgi:Kef-type K+ transport system membrane component KefB
MNESSKMLITLGGVLLLGFLTDGIGRRTRLPRVTLLLLFGIAIGPSGFALLAELPESWFPNISSMALVMVGFLLGGKLTLPSLREHGRLVIWISVVAVAVTAFITLIGLLAIGVPLALAALLGAIATATAPAATADVVHEMKARGRFSRTLLGIIALDDAWGLVLFSLALSLAFTLRGASGIEALTSGTWEVGGAVLLGVLLGMPMAYLTGRVRPGEPTLAEALGLVFLCGGLAMFLDVSFLLAAMVMGAVVANLAAHHDRPFHAIEGIEWPFMILFFVFAGASLELETLLQLGSIGSAYVVLRVIGRLLGGWLGGTLAHAPHVQRRWMGAALMPQAGVAVGMALVASERFPEFGPRILSVVIASTVLFEIFGPMMTRRALIAAGEGTTTRP